MEDKNPLISVLMTAYNREKFIGEAIESVLKSDYQNWELIIVDDASDDFTVSIAKKYEARDKRIRVYVNEINLGDYPNRNKAASYANGEFLQYLDSDDIIYDDSLSKMIALASKFPDVGLFMSSQEGEIKHIAANTSVLRHFFEKQFLFYGPGGTFIRRSFFNKIHGYPVKYGPANDMYFNLKAGCQSPIVLHPYTLLFYREHEGQESKKEFIYLIENYRYMRDALNELPLPFTAKQISWLKKKNCRRFIVNLFSYSKKDFNIQKIIIAWKRTDFKFSYLLSGIFH